MTNSPVVEVKDLPGLIATVCTTGHVTPEYSQSLSDLRSWNDRNNLHKVEYKVFSAKLVESGRDAVVRHALSNNYEWILQIDADAFGFPDDSLMRMFQTAYIDYPQCDAVGGYCQLKGDMCLPTIDTGTGHWEEWYPKSGVLQVIRTGAHFLFTKTPLLRRMSPTGQGPWFRTRKPMRPVDAMFEVDNFARVQLDGRNPFWVEDGEWETLLASAVQASPERHADSSHVGEDSGFCDRALAHGAIILVDTHLVAGHVGTKYYTPEDLREYMVAEETKIKQACGLLEF